MATRKKKIVEENIKETTVVKGSHLTVTTHPDGRTELEWDDEALLRDVRAATAGVVSAPEKKTKKKKA
jgi:YD repeat-containing protein